MPLTGSCGAGKGRYSLLELCNDTKECVGRDYLD